MDFRDNVSSDYRAVGNPLHSEAGSSTMHVGSVDMYGNAGVSGVETYSRGRVRSSLVEAVNEVAVDIDKHRYQEVVQESGDAFPTPIADDRPLEEKMQRLEEDITNESDLYNLLKEAQEALRHVALSQYKTQRDLTPRMNSYRSTVVSAGKYAEKLTNELWTLHSTTAVHSDTTHAADRQSNVSAGNRHELDTNPVPREFIRILSSLFTGDQSSLSVTPFLANSGEHTMDDRVDWVSSITLALYESIVASLDGALSPLRATCAECIQSASVLEQWKNHKNMSLRKAFVQSFIWLSLSSMLAPLVKQQVLDWILSLLHNAYTQTRLAMAHSVVTTIPDASVFNLDMAQLLVKLSKNQNNGPTDENTGDGRGASEENIGLQETPEEVEATEVMARLVPHTLSSSLTALLLPIMQQPYLFLLLPMEVHGAFVESIGKIPQETKEEQIPQEFFDQLVAACHDLSSTLPPEALAICRKKWTVDELPQLPLRFIILFFHVIKINRVIALWNQSLPPNQALDLANGFFEQSLHTFAQAVIEAIQTACTISTGSGNSNHYLANLQLSLLLLLHFFVLDMRKQWIAHPNVLNAYILSFQHYATSIETLCSSVRDHATVGALVSNEDWEQIVSNLIIR